jgi:TonB family protein
MLQVLTLSAALAWLASHPQGQVQESSPAKPILRIEMVVLTDVEGVDFNSYLGDLYRRVRSRWFAAMPESAIAQGNQTKVVVHFKIQRDGTLPHKNPAIEVSSGDKSKDNAATAAIRTAAPFEQLPKPFSGQNIELRVRFTYGLPPLHP